MSSQHNSRIKMTREELRNKRLQKLILNTGCDIETVNGQRIIRSRTPWCGPTPTKGSEVFIGKIPKYLFEDELFELFERPGAIYSLRIMMDFSGMNRGFAFVMYRNSETASLAVTHLNNYEIRPYRHIGVYKSIDNCRLFLGNIPQDKSRSEILTALQHVVEGVVDVIMLPSNTSNRENEKYNRGYVFIEFDCHRSAAIARRLFGTGGKLWDTPVVVDWADPLPEVDPDIMKGVTTLYIRNVNVSLTNSKLQLHLTQCTGSDGITRVFKTADYAFVHFSSRIEAESAMKRLIGATIAGKVIEVEWARPITYSKQNRWSTPEHHFCTSLPSQRRKLLRMQNGDTSTPEMSPSAVSSSSCSSPSTSPFGQNFGVIETDTASCYHF